jgi:hypothetical protein
MFVIVLQVPINHEHKDCTILKRYVMLVLNGMHNAHNRCHGSKVIIGDKQTNIHWQHDDLKSQISFLQKAQHATGQHVMKNIPKYEVINFCTEF